MGNKTYIITLYGCDDSTRIEIELTPNEIELVRRLESLFEDASTYQCMPTLQVKEKEAAHEKQG